MNNKKANINNPDYKKAMKSVFDKKAEQEEQILCEETQAEEPRKNKTFKNLLEQLDASISVQSIKSRFSKQKKGNPFRFDEPDEYEEENIDFCTLAIEELKTKKDYFSSLLDHIADICESSTSKSEKLFPDRILNKWNSAMKVGECKGLLQKIETAYEQDKPENDVQKLQIILNILYEMGLKKLEFPDRTVTVSVENRGYFENGNMFPDGSICTVEYNVWTYEDEVYVRGLLGKMLEDKADNDSNAEHFDESEEAEEAETQDCSACSEKNDCISAFQEESLAQEPQKEDNSKITVPIMGCSAKYKNKTTFILELIITYKGFPRFMELETAKKQIAQGVKSAIEKGFKKLCVCLIGGDALEWDCFKELCEYVSQTSWEVPVEFCAEVYGASLNPENEKWLFENLCKVNLTFCTTDKDPLNSWRQHSVLYNPMVSTVRVCIVKDNLDFMKDELASLLALNKRIQLVFPDLQKWEKSDYQKFLSSISPLIMEQIYCNKSQLLPCDDSGCLVNGRRRLKTVDMDSTVYFCRYLSMEHLSPSDIPGFSKTIKCEHLCPAAEKFKKYDFFEQLFNSTVRTVTEKIKTLSPHDIDM